MYWCIILPFGDGDCHVLNDHRLLETPRSAFPTEGVEVCLSPSRRQPPERVPPWKAKRKTEKVNVDLNDTIGPIRYVYVGYVLSMFPKQVGYTETKQRIWKK